MKRNEHDVPSTTTEVQGRVYLDLSSIKSNEELQVTPRVQHWRMIVDELTKKKVSHFYETKDGMDEPTCEIFCRWTKAGKGGQCIRMDNGGENKLLVKRMNSREWKLYPKIEFTARVTPQHNHLVEVGYLTWTIRGQSICLMAGQYV
jgi:hypothetical protein